MDAFVKRVACAQSCGGCGQRQGTTWFVNRCFGCCFTGEKGFTPLIMACSQGYTESTKALLDAGANINYVSPFDGATALHHAVTGGYSKKSLWF